MKDDAERNEYGLKVARDFARWHLGYPSWGERIVDAYLNPDRVHAELQAEMDDD